MNRSRRFISTVFAFALFAATTARIDAQVQVFTKNQLLKGGTSPVTIPVNYDNGTSLATAAPVGSPVHIVYGIQVTSNNTNPTNHVMVTITPPPGFNSNAVRCIRFPLGGPTGTPVPSSGCPLPALNSSATFDVAPLSGANDKELIVIDGVFTQAGNFTATFDAKRDQTDEPTTLNMLAKIFALPVDLSVTKEVKPKGGSTFGATASIPITGTVTYHIIVKNLAAPAADHSTDVFLGSQFRLFDTLSASGTTDVVLGLNPQSITCTPSGGADCPSVAGTYASSLSAGQSRPLVSSGRLTYPTGSLGLLPAGASFEITFDVEITTTPSACSPHQNNALVNDVFFTYSDGTSSLDDTQPSNNSSTTKVTITGIPATPCPPPPPTASVTKQLLSPPAWGAPLKFLVTIQNTSLQTQTTLTGLGMQDWVSASGTPPVTATFAPTASNVVCTPACIATPAASTTLVVPSVSSPTIFSTSALFAPLAPGAVQTIQYEIQFDAGCSVTSGSGSMLNSVQIFNSQLTASGSKPWTMPPLPLCSIDVVKTQTSGPTSFSTYPVTVGYHVDFKNTSATGSVTVRTLIDAISLESAIYGDVPIGYSYSCTATNVLLPTGTPLTKAVPSATVTHNNPLRAGLRLIDLSSAAGAAFSHGGIIGCDITVTLKQPSAHDAFCKGDDPQRDLVNVAFMDLGNSFNNSFNTNTLTPAKESSQVRVTLPKCVAISVGKTVGPNVVAGGAVTFTLTVTNAAKTGTIANITLHDHVPASFTNVTWTCASGCTPGSGSGQNIDVPLNPIAAGATTTIVVHANAPIVLGSYCNATNATFDPFPDKSYFEGDAVALTQASACAQVESPPGLIIQKQVTGAPAGFTSQFQFNVQCSTPIARYQKSVTVNWPTPGFVAVNDIPANMDCTVSEGPLPPAPNGYAWSGLPVYTPAGGAISIGSKGGAVSVVNKLVPESCGRIVASSVTCEVDANGKPTGRYIWKFRFQNLSGVPTGHLFIVGLPFPVTVDHNDLQFIPAVTNLSPLNTVVFSGASPGPITFNVSLNCGSLDDCCSFPVTLDLPECDCAQVIGESAPSCGFPNPGSLTYTIKLQNLSTHVVENLVVVPVSPNDHVTPVPPSLLTVTNEINPVTPTGQGGTIGPVTVTLSGAQATPGNQVCLSLGLLEKDFRDCCSIVRCFRIPDCSRIDSTEVSPLGAAIVTRAGTGFQIDHIGSTGDDGISINLKDADKAGLAWRPLDAAGPLPNGAFIELRAAGDADEMKGDIRVTQAAAGQYEITSSIDDAREYTIDVFDGTQLVDTVPAPAGINITGNWPVAAGVELVPAASSGEPDTLAFTLQTDQSTGWILADGSFAVGDRLRITPNDSSGRTASLQTLELRAANIPSIAVTGVSISHDCNGNGVADAEEIASGAVADDNHNGIPDECETESFDISLNTGFDQAAGTLLPIGTLPDGTSDDDWKIVVPAPERPAKIVISPPAPWAAPFDLTRWVSLDPNQGASTSATQLGFERCFCLAPDAREITLDLKLRADNEATVLLNGQTLAGPGGAFNAATPLTIHRTGAAGDGLFVTGRNCLRVNVTDFGVFTGLDAAGSVTGTGNECSSQ